MRTNRAPGRNSQDQFTQVSSKAAEHARMDGRNPPPSQELGTALGVTCRSRVTAHDKGSVTDAGREKLVGSPLERERACGAQPSTRGPPQDPVPTSLLQLALWRYPEPRPCLPHQGHMVLTPNTAPLPRAGEGTTTYRGFARTSLPFHVLQTLRVRGQGCTGTSPNPLS